MVIENKFKNLEIDSKIRGFLAVFNLISLIPRLLEKSISDNLPLISENPILISEKGLYISETSFGGSKFK
jgi:hypothetical protein